MSEHKIYNINMKDGKVSQQIEFIMLLKLDENGLIYNTPLDKVIPTEIENGKRKHHGVPAEVSLKDNEYAIGVVRVKTTGTEINSTLKILVFFPHGETYVGFSAEYMPDPLKDWNFPMFNGIMLLANIIKGSM